MVISGYYGFSNAGDDAVLSAIVAGLKSCAESVDITVLSASPDATGRTYGVHAIPRTSIADVSNAIRHCDLFISGGGSLLQDATSLLSLIYYLGTIWLARLFRRKVMILGQGIGPLRSPVSRFMTKMALNGVNLITVRDTESAELLRSIGVCTPTVRVTADPTLALSPCSPDHAMSLLAGAGIGHGDDVIAVALRDWPEYDGLAERFHEAFAAISHELPAKLLLITMHTPDDAVFSARVAHGTDCVVQPGQWTPDELLGVLGQCKFVVGMRLHALIFAASVGVPCIGISYDPKVESFLDAIGQSKITLPEVVAGELATQVVDAWHRRDALASILAERVPIMREAARENIRLALELLDT